MQATAFYSLVTYYSFYKHKCCHFSVVLPTLTKLERSSSLCFCNCKRRTKQMLKSEYILYMPVEGLTLQNF